MLPEPVIRIIKGTSIFIPYRRNFSLIIISHFACVQSIRILIKISRQKIGFALSKDLIVCSHQYTITIFPSIWHPLNIFVKSHSFFIGFPKFYKVQYLNCSWVCDAHRISQPGWIAWIYGPSTRITYISFNFPKLLLKIH